MQTFDSKILQENLAFKKFCQQTSLVCIGRFQVQLVHVCKEMSVQNPERSRKKKMRELKKHDEVSKLGRKLLLIASFSSVDEQSSNILILVVQTFGLKTLEFCLLHNLTTKRKFHVIFPLINCISTRQFIEYMYMFCNINYNNQKYYTYFDMNLK